MEGNAFRDAPDLSNWFTPSAASYAPPPPAAQPTPGAELRGTGPGESRDPFVGYADQPEQRIAQGVYYGTPLSMPEASYRAGEGLADAASAAQDGRWKDAAAGAAPAILIGLPGVRRLEQAGMRSPTAWGGTGRYQKAMDAIEKGAPQDNAFRDFGWATNAYGNDTVPYSAISDKKMSVNLPPTVFHDGQFQQTNQAKGPLGRYVDHPELFAAYPFLKRLPIDPGDLAIRSGMKAGDQNGGTNMFLNLPLGVMAHANSEPMLKSILTHELQHGASALSKLPQGANPSMVDPSFTSPEVTDMIKNYQDRAREYGVRLGPTSPSGLPGAPQDPGWLQQMMPWSRVDPDALSKLKAYHPAIDQVGRMEAYGAKDGEELARGEQRILEMKGRDAYKTPRQFDYVDPYDMRFLFGSDRQQARRPPDRY